MRIKQRKRDIHTLKVLVFHGDVCMLHYRQPHVLDVITDALRVFKITHVRQVTRKHVPSSECFMVMSACCIIASHMSLMQ